MTNNSEMPRGQLRKARVKSDLSYRHRPEMRQRRLLDRLFAGTDLSNFDMFRNFPVFTPRVNLARFLAHYELFKKICELPGVIIDLGVFRGASTFTWAKLCEILCPTDIRKTVYAFDTFAGFPELSEEDGAADSRLDKVAGGYCGGVNVLSQLVLARAAMNEDRHLRHIERVSFVKGDACKTIPKFVRKCGSGLRVALLNLDADLYKPTMTALEWFVPLMTKGGIIVCDEYATGTFGGESKAIDDYFRRIRTKRPSIRKFPWHSSPSAFIEVTW